MIVRMVKMVVGLDLYTGESAYGEDGSGVRSLYW